MKKTATTKDWFRLGTCKQFDKGFPKTKEAELSSANSLFIESLIQQLCRYLEKDPSKQRKIYNAICSKLFDMRVIDESYHAEEFASLRGHYWDALSAFVRAPDMRTPLLETSRYAIEFDELELLASGGFGQVFRARHKLDQVEYAVKKIKVRNKDAAMFLQTLSEVKTLARLNHSNIVHYKAAWLEACTFPALPAIQDASNSDASDIVIFQGSNDSASDVSEDGGCNVVCHYRPPHTPLSSMMGAVLYVTMELCDETLRQWLDRRNANNTALNFALALDVMRQISSGIAYIHKENVVHHDIKPSNIFVSSDLRVQVGDFGLACSLQGHGSCPLLAGHRGTGLYAAPEQLRGKCHQRSDLFSLGLVFLELLVPFCTNMERVAVLHKARDRIIPSDLPPLLQGLLLDLMEPDPNKRPSAAELVERLQNCDSPHMDDKDFTILELRRLLAEKELEIRMLKERAGA